MTDSGDAGGYRLLSAAGPGKAVLRVANAPDAASLLKDYSANRLLFRVTCGAYMASREAAAYRRLGSVDGVPRLHRRVWPDGLLLQYIAGQNCLQQTRPLDAAFFQRLRETLTSLRARGVLHGDVKRNVLVSADGLPVLVDFGASFVVRWWLWPLRSWLLAVAAVYDDRAVAKLTRRVAPHSLTAHDQQLLVAKLPFESIVKRGERLIQCFYRRSKL